MDEGTYGGTGGYEGVASFIRRPPMNVNQAQLAGPKRRNQSYIMGSPVLFQDNTLWSDSPSLPALKSVMAYEKLGDVEA